MTDELRVFAEELILGSVEYVEMLTVVEQGEDYLNREMTEDEVKRVMDLFYEATITVSWPDDEQKESN